MCASFLLRGSMSECPERKKSFISFHLFFGNESFQRVKADLNKKNLFPFGARTASPAFPGNLTDSDDLGRPLTKRAVSQARPSSIVDATAPAALLAVAAEAVRFVRLRNGC